MAMRMKAMDRLRDKLSMDSYKDMEGRNAAEGEEVEGEAAPVESEESEEALAEGKDASEGDTEELMEEGEETVAMPGQDEPSPELGNESAVAEEVDFEPVDKEMLRSRLRKPTPMGQMPTASLGIRKPR